MNTLAFLSTHLRDEWRARLTRTCLTLIDRLNPDIHYLVVDNASPIDPLPWLPGEWLDGGVCLPPGTESGLGTIPDRPGRRTLVRFPDSLGHFHADERRIPPPMDGPGRAIMVGLRIAHHYGYERVVHQGNDALCAMSYQSLFDQMMKPVACLPDVVDGYPEWDIFTIKDLDWLINFQFIEKYGWPDQKPDWMGAPVGELVYKRIFAGHYDVIPLRGGRGSMHGIDAHNMREKYPDGIDWGTHWSPEGFATFLDMTGHADLIPMLHA